MKSDARVTVRWPQDEVAYYEQFQRRAAEQGANASELARQLIRKSLDAEHDVAGEVALLRESVDALLEANSGGAAEAADLQAVERERTSAYQGASSEALDQIIKTLRVVVRRLAEAEDQRKEAQTDQRAAGDAVVELLRHFRTASAARFGGSTPAGGTSPPAGTAVMKDILAVLERLLQDQRATHNLICEVFELPRHRQAQRASGGARRFASRK